MLVPGDPPSGNPVGVCLKSLTYAEGECGDGPRSWTTAPIMPREPPSQVSRDVLRYRAGLGFGCRPAAVLSRKSESSVHHGSSQLSSAAPWAIWSLGASLVPQFGPQAAGEQVTGRGLALLEGA